MATLEQRLTELLTAPVEALGFELWGIEFVRAGRHSTLRIYIDGPDGVSVENCAEVSRQAGALLDVEDPISDEYTLEVSSPGLDRLLFSVAQFEKYLGKEVLIQLRMAIGNRRKFKGIIQAVNGDMITLTVDGAETQVAFPNIQKANIVPHFG